MGFHLSALFILAVSIHITLAGQQQIHTHESIGSTSKGYYYQNDGQQQIGQRLTDPHTTSSVKKSYSLTSSQQAPVRWRTTNDYKLDTRHDASRELGSTTSNLQSSLETSYVSNKDTDSHIEEKHEELRRRTIRMRLLTTQQNDLRKELQSNETMLNEQLRANNLENVQSLQLLIAAIRNCFRTFDRIQNELQKLYRDQIFEEKALLELYRISRPNDQMLHNQLSRAIERWELIYNQLLDMQLNEKRKNEERERKFEKLLNELDAIQRTTPTYSPYLSKSQSYYASSNIVSSTPSSKSNLQQTVYASQQPAKISISSSSYSSSYDSKANNTHSSYSSNLKTSGTDQPSVYYSSSQITKNPTLSHTNSDLEEGKLIFRRPESSSLKEIKCLDKWYQDLGLEDDQWIARHQSKNEEMFKELVRMQKLQWDTLLVEHNKKKQQHIPQTFKCELETQALCDQEEANFRQKFNDYRLDKWPSNIDTQKLSYNQQMLTSNQQQPTYSQNYQKIQKIN